MICWECDKLIKWYQFKVRDKKYPTAIQHARCTRRAMRPIRWAVMRYRNGVRLEEEVKRFSFKKKKDDRIIDDNSLMWRPRLNGKHYNL